MEIIVINPDLADVAQVERARIVEDETQPDLSWLEAFNTLYEMNESKSADWPDVPITVGLPKTDTSGNLVNDYRFSGKRAALIEPIKKVIEQPTLFEVATLSKKAAGPGQQGAL